MQTRGRFTGLHTAVAETSAPGGALRVADNVCLRKQGVLSPRQGFVPEPLTYLPANAPGAMRAAHPHGGVTIYEDQVSLRRTADGAAMHVIDSFLTYALPVRLRDDVRHSVRARGHLYVPYSTGVWRLGDNAFERAGLVTQWIGVHAAGPTSDTAPVLPPSTHVGYRMVLMKKDARGVVTRSRPTGVVRVANTTVSSVCSAMVGTVYQMSSHHTLEIYRTRTFPLSAQLDDEMQLVASMSYAELLGGYQWSFVDRLPDAARTTTLYTSPSRGGIENANDRPPACAVAALYKGSVFYGNTVGPQRFVASFRYAAVQTGKAAGIGTRRVACRITAGQSTVTSVTPIAGIERGMVVTYSNGAFPHAVFVMNIVGTTVTLSQVAYYSQADADLVFSDAIELAATGWIAVGSESVTAGNLNVSSVSHRFGAYELSPPEVGMSATTVFETIDRNQPAFTLRATHGGEYSPPLPLYGMPVSAQQTSSEDRHPNGLAWSSPDEPEHVPPKFFAQVGERDKAILGLATTRDSLFVLKEDGIYRVTGTNGNFRIDPFDLTTFCMLPSSVRTLNGRIYFLAQKGLVALDDSGVEVVSAPIADELALVVEHIRAEHATSGLYRYTGFAGDAGATDDRNHEYLLALPSGVTSFGGDVLVYHTLHGGFTTYSFTRGDAPLGFAPTGYGVRHDGVPLVLHQGGVRAGQSVRVTAAGASHTRTADGVVSAPGTATALPDGTARLVLSASLPLRVGDVVASAETAARVVAVESLTSVVLSSLVGTPRSAYRAITCTCEPQGFTSPELTGKLWTHAVWALSRLVGTSELTARFTSATPTVDAAAQEVREKIAVPLGTRGIANHVAGTLLRLTVPSVHRRGWMLRVGLLLDLAFGEFLLELVAADSREHIPNKNQTHSTGVL